MLSIEGRKVQVSLNDKLRENRLRERLASREIALKRARLSIKFKREQLFSRGRLVGAEGGGGRVVNAVVRA